MSIELEKRIKTQRLSIPSARTNNREDTVTEVGTRSGNEQVTW